MSNTLQTALPVPEGSRCKAKPPIVTAAFLRQKLIIRYAKDGKLQKYFSPGKANRITLVSSDRYLASD